MKKILCLFLFGLATGFVFSEKSVDEVLKNFDNALLKSSSTTAQTAIGFITYADTNTSGTVATYFQKEIEKAAKNTRRIKIVPSSSMGESEQVVVATRSVNLGMMKKKNTTSRKYVIDGIYIERNENIVLTLFMRDSDGEIVSEQTAEIRKKEIDDKKLTLYPENIKLAAMIQQDFDSVSQVNVQENKMADAEKKILIAASMLDKENNLVNILYPDDTVKFKVSTNHNCYLAILMISADGEKQWLPISDSFMTANTTRYFPDIPGAVLRVMDGFFGAEQVVIYAASTREALPPQTDEGIYTKQNLQQTRKFQLERQQEDVAMGTFKITYTVMRK